MHILRWMGSKSCVKFQRCPLKFHTKFWTHTPQNMHFTDCYFSLWFTISWNCDVISLSETAPWNITPNLMVFSYDKVLIFRRFQLYQWSRVDRIWSQQSSWPFYRLVGVVYKWYSCEIIGWKYFASSGWNWRHYGYKNDLSSHMFYYTTAYWQVLPQLSCGDTCQIWTWYSEGKQWFDDFESLEK